MHTTRRDSPHPKEPLSHSSFDTHPAGLAAWLRMAL